MKRIFEDFLLDWKNRKTRKPLIIRGARQVGKTYLVDNFGKNHFKNYVRINLEENEDVKELFKIKNTITICENLSILFGETIKEGETLLFIDEIQAMPEAIATLRYFYEQQPELHVIAAGSLLDHTLNEIKYSMPVGRVEFGYLYPMNFKEFLLAMGEEKLVEFIENFEIDSYLAKSIYDKLFLMLRRYFFIGGMPEAVKIYASTGDLLEVERIHENILMSLEYDFAKYGTKTEQQHLTTVFRQIFKNIGKKIKYVNLNPNIRPEALRNALYKLEMSRIINLVNYTNANQIPLEHGTKEIFKPIFLDIGLLNHLLKVRLLDTDNIMTIHEGALAEQFVGQELLTIPPYFIDKKLYYWLRESKNSNAEIDYLWEHKKEIIPLEVKSGKAGTLKSLFVYCFENKKNKAVRLSANTPEIQHIETQIRLKAKNQDVKLDLMTIPLFLAYKLPKFIDSFL